MTQTAAAAQVIRAMLSGAEGASCTVPHRSWIVTFPHRVARAPGIEDASRGVANCVP